MKDIVTFVLVSLLIFGIVNGDDFNGGLHSRLVNPIMASSIPIPKSTNVFAGNSTELGTNLQNFLVLGFQEKDLKNGIFFVIARIISMNTPNHITLKANVETSSNLRFLEGKQEVFNCPLDEEESQEFKENHLYIFKCNGTSSNYSSINIDLGSMEIDGNKAYSIPAAALTKDIGKANDDVVKLLFGKEIIAMKECKFTDKENKVIEGTMESSINSPDKPNLLLPDNDKSKKIDCHYEDKSENKYSITLDTDSKLNKNLHGQIGRINDKQTVILDFADGLGDTNPSSYKKSSSGLSTGAIVAIVIPCIALLLAAAGLAFILGNRNIKPPMQNLENNTIGVNSSATVNNK